MKKYFHGENSITFSMFSNMDEHRLSRLFSNALWNRPVKISPKQILFVHLFPNFGKRYGYGEPDAIVITDDVVVYVEVELVNLSKRKMPPAFLKQMAKFVALASDLNAANRKKLVKKFQGESGYSFYGRQALRRIFDQIQLKKRTAAFLIISDGDRLDFDAVASQSGFQNKATLGWISFNKIKDMMGISEINKVIKHVLEP